MRVLLVEDDEPLADSIAGSLRESLGYAVDVAADGAQGLYLAESSPYDLIVLDLMLPKLDGHSLLVRYRAQGYATPVMIVSARDEKESVIRLLNAGADDYLSKPFFRGELLARARALVRRGTGQRSPVLTMEDLRMDTAERSVQRGHSEIALSPMEYRVLEYLAFHPRSVVSKTELLEHLYDYNWEKFSNVIEVYVSGLRRKIDDSNPVKLIHTVRGHGYVLRPGR
jgi:two-component system response regulator PhoP